LIELKSVSNPPADLEPVARVAPVRATTEGRAGTASAEASRSLKHLAAKGRGEPLPRRPAPAGLKSILGTDDRVRILDTDLAPWRMVCALRLRGRSGAAIGTGWFVGPRTLLTAGHCVYSTHFFGGWATEIEVSPGRNRFDFPFRTVKSRRFSSVDRWVGSEDPDFDVGCIHLEDPVGEEVGWFAVGALPPDELQGYFVNVSGYPGDRGEGTEQYHHKNRVVQVTDRRLFYDVDTFGGQSGAPVWIHETDAAPPLAVGIHAYGVGGSPTEPEANSAPRIIPEVLDRVRGWVDGDGAVR
jgi:glutamyl endopeptidase